VKYLGYIFRNTRRNPIRSVLTIGSIAICGFLTMILLSLFSTNKEIGTAVRDYNRLFTMSTQGFGQLLPIALVRDIERLDEQSGVHGLEKTPEGRPAVTPFSWFGGNYAEETSTMFAQFAVDPDTVFFVYPELTLPADQLKAFRERKDGAVIGRKLAADKNLKVGDAFPLRGTFYPFNLDLTVVGIYDGPARSDLRTCYFNWEYLNEGLKKTVTQEDQADVTGTIVMKCKNASVMPALSKVVDDATHNSDKPTKTQSEEAFIAMFSEMIGDLQTYINWVGLAVAGALVMICGVSMAMSMRERTTEVAVLKAIGFRKGIILFLVLAEAVLIAGLGGLFGSIGTKLLFDVWDISPYTGGMFPYFYVPWETALIGLVGAVLIGLISGLIPAVLAAKTPVVDGLRKVV
jgi:putative ABC transport system permease protein